MPRWTRQEGVTLSKDGWRRESPQLALLAIVCVAFFLHGRSGNSRGREERLLDYTGTKFCRSEPTGYAGFLEEAVGVVRPYIA